MIDIKTMEVLRIDDHGIVPIPKADVNYDRDFRANRPGLT